MQELRNQFFGLLHNRVGSSLPQRLTHIVSTQDWDPLSNTLWLRQAVQLFLATAESQQRLVMPPVALQLPTLSILTGAADNQEPKLRALLAEHRHFLSECQSGGAFHP